MFDDHEIKYMFFLNPKSGHVLPSTHVGGHWYALLVDGCCFQGSGYEDLFSSVGYDHMISFGCSKAPLVTAVTPSILNVSVVHTTRRCWLIEFTQSTQICFYNPVRVSDYCNFKTILIIHHDFQYQKFRKYQYEIELWVQIPILVNLNGT